jgi:hypothetical protein
MFLCKKKGQSKFQKIFCQGKRVLQDLKHCQRPVKSDEIWPWVWGLVGTLPQATLDPL